MTKSGRKKLVIELQYLGTAYDGWQPQPNQSSVYDVVAAALHKCTDEMHGPVVAGRTDKGVHAAHQLIPCARIDPTTTTRRSSQR